jgi:transposase
VEKLKGIPPDQLIYVDEAGIDEYLYREYARAARGVKVYAKISGRKFYRVNIVAGICLGSWLAPLQYSGTTDSLLFEYWFENRLLKEAKTGSVIVLDNATFHKKAVLPGLAEKYGCTVLFLPPYSPDLNPIETKWAWLKRTLRKILPEFDSFDLALQDSFQFS